MSHSSNRTFLCLKIKRNQLIKTSAEINARIFFLFTKFSAFDIFSLRQSFVTDYYKDFLTTMMIEHTIKIICHFYTQINTLRFRSETLLN